MRHRSRALAVALLGLAVGGGLCQPAPAPLVLSGDEVLQSGPLRLDERDLQALVTADGVRLRGRLASTIPLSLGGRVQLSLRDLDERPVGEGSGELQADASGAHFEAWIQPGLKGAQATQLARHVVHGTVQGLGQTLRFRRSLYQASLQLDAELILPSAPLPGTAFPLLAGAVSAPPGTLLDVTAVAGGGAPEALGSAELDDEGVAQLLLQAPAAGTEPSALHTALIGEVGRVLFEPPVRLAGPPDLTLWTGGGQASPGDRVDVIGWVRSPAGLPRAGARGELCLSATPALLRACRAVVADDEGLLVDRIDVAPALAGRKVLLELAVEGALAQAWLEVATAGPLDLPFSQALTPERLESGELRVPLRLPPVAPGFTLHAELRLGDAAGPLLSERDLPLDATLDAVQLPLPDAAALASDRWVLRLGVVDGVGRRAARDQELRASAGALAVWLLLPEQPRAGRPLCALLVARTLDGAPAVASGTLRVGEQALDVTTDGSGAALACAEPAAVSALQASVELRDASDRTGGARALVRVLPDAAAGLELEAPLILTAEQQLPVRLHARAPARTRGLWLLASGRVLDQSASPTATLRATGHAPDSLLSVAGFASAASGQLWQSERRVLADDSGARLVLEPAPAGRVLPLLYQRGGGDGVRVRWLASTAQALPRVRQVLDEDAVRALAEGALEPSASEVLASALQPSTSLSHQRATAQPDPSVLAVAEAKVEADLASIGDDLAARFQQGEVVASDLPDWVARRAAVYYDPWGQPYALSLADGQLWLSSRGFDEQPGTLDDTRRGLYLHDLLQAPGEPWPAPVADEDWSRALRPSPVIRPASGSDLDPWIDGQALEVLGLTAQGQTLRARYQGGPLLELHAPTALRLRAGDALQVPLDLRSDALDGLQVQAWTDAPEALLLDVAPTPIAASPGWQRHGLQLRARSTVQAHLQVLASDPSARRQRTVAVLARDRDQERAALASLCLWLDGSAAWQLSPQPSASRRQRRLVARAFVDGHSLALALHAALPEPLTTDGARAALALPLADVANAAPVAWAIARVLALQRADGSLDDEAGRASVRATLTGVEALAAIESGWGARQPALDAALQWIASSLDARGALTPELVAADARALERERLRATARLVLALQASRPGDALVERAAGFLRGRVGLEHDAMTTALLLRALAAIGADSTTRDAVLEQLRARTQVDATTGTRVFTGEPDDGAEASLLANAHGLLALRALDQWDALAQAARDVVLRAVQPEQVRARVETQAVVLQALAALPRATSPASSVLLQLADGTAGQVTDAAECVLPAPATDVVGTLQGAGPAQLLLLWLEGEPALPLRAGPEVGLEAPALLALRVGQVERLPVQLEPEAGPLRVELQSSPCLVAALHTPLRRLTPRADGVLTALLDEVEREGSAVVVQALCPGQLSLPVLRVAPAAEPWRVSTSAPGLVVIE